MKWNVAGILLEVGRVDQREPLLCLEVLERLKSVLRLLGPRVQAHRLHLAV